MSRRPVRAPVRWARGVRARTAISATVVVAVTLLLAAAALVVLQRQQLVQAVTLLARQQGEAVAQQIRDGGVGTVDLAAVGGASREQTLVQVVTPDGLVVAASSDVEGEQPVSSATTGAGQVDVRSVPELPIGEDDPFVVVVTGVATPDGVVRVITAQSLESVQRSTAVTLTLVGVGYPLLLLAVGVTSYVFAGRALAPVEAIRRRVGEVTAQDLSARVPVPATGDEIARLAETMNVMLGRLQGSAAAQSRFVADASHELRSPLATIRAAAEVSGSHPEAMDWPAAASTVLAETDRLERLVSDLLLLARSDEEGLVMRAEDVDLDDVVVAEAARVRQAGVAEVVVDVRSVRVRGDAQHLVRAVRNLTDNAARYSRSTVTLRLRAQDATAQLEVLDDGPGIVEAERERVFERFVRLDTSRERGTGGTGLGLAITRQVARAHGGDVEVTAPTGSGVRSGARFVLTLPLPAAASWRG
ncbi:ATP-binding protein [Jannaschia sp. R86511]|uniref:ATP-binding protein n=1 Tax=Jannaschia sp. R86511 TaxID=3093853 RepID=UPI0036D24CC0